MKRYHPSEEERARIAGIERALGIRNGSAEHPTGDGERAAAGGNDAAGGQDAAGGNDAAGSLRTPTLPEWRDLWINSPADWATASRRRPQRLAPDTWRRAVLEWNDGLPPQPERPPRPFEGVPFLVKDLFDVSGEVTRCGSAVLGRGVGGGAGAAVPTSSATRDSWLVARLRSLGAHPMGRTAMNEFAYGLDGRNAATGDCPHPWDPARISGGSSSGSAWAVARGVVPLALGTDTGGSIRVPAAICGVYGIRLAYRDDRLAGTFPLSPSMDTVGWFARSAADAARSLAGVLDVALTEDEPAHDASADGGPAHNAPLRLAALVPPGVALAPDGERVWTAFLAALTADSSVATVTTVTAPSEFGEEAWKAYNVLGSRDAWTVHERWLDLHRESYEPVVWSLIDRGRGWSDERVSAASATRERVRTAMADLLRRFDGVVIPATPTPSPMWDEADGRFREALLRLNAPGSLAGCAAVSVPVSGDGVRSGGVQVLVDRDHEATLVRFLERWQEVRSQEERTG